MGSSRRTTSMAWRIPLRSPSSSSTSMWMRQNASGSNQAKARSQPQATSSTSTPITAQRFIRAVRASLELHQRAHDAVVLVVALVLVVEACRPPLVELDGVAGFVDEDRHRPDESVFRAHVDAGPAACVLAVPEAAAPKAAAGGIGIDRADVHAHLAVVLGRAVAQRLQRPLPL